MDLVLVDRVAVQVAHRLRGASERCWRKDARFDSAKQPATNLDLIGFAAQLDFVALHHFLNGAANLAQTRIDALGEKWSSPNKKRRNARQLYRLSNAGVGRVAHRVEQRFELRIRRPCPASQARAAPSQTKKNQHPRARADNGRSHQAQSMIRPLI